MNDPLYNRLQETIWRRRLSAAEEAELRAWLAAHPEARADWEVESGLNEALTQIPDAPVATNFTARVLKAIERETGGVARQPVARWSWRRLLPKAAGAAFVLGIAVFSYSEYRQSQRERIAEDLVMLSRVAGTPSPEVFARDFKAIRSLNQPGPDEELLQMLTAAK